MAIRSRLKLRLRSISGMTLMEIFVALFIFLALLGGITLAADASEKYWKSNKTRIELQQELRLASIWISSELRQAGVSSIIDVYADGTPYTWITFKIPSGVNNGTKVWSTNSIRYILLSDADGKKLGRVQGTGVRIIARDIEAMEFVREADDPTTLKDESNIVKVSLTAQKDTDYGRTITSDLNFSVELRN